MMVNIKGLEKAKREIRKMHSRCPRAVDVAVRGEAESYRALVIQGFREGGTGGKKWSKLTPITRRIRKSPTRQGIGKGGTKVLMVSAQLRNSVTVHKQAESEYFVGVLRSEKGFNIARVHELGAVIPVTEKMRAYFRYLLAIGVLRKPWPPSSKTTIIVRPRSYLGDAFEWFRRGFDARVATRVATYILEGKALPTSIRGF